MTWEPYTRSAIVELGEHSLRFTIGSDLALVNGVVTPVPVPARLIAGRAMVPLRFLAEQLRVGVAWEDGARLVLLTRW